MEKLGLIAGTGKLPVLVAEAARKEGIDEVIGIAIYGQTPPQLEASVSRLYWIGIGELGKLIKIFTKENVKKAVMIGQLPHISIFKNLKFDMRMITMVARLKDRRADSILGAIAEELGKDGITVMDSTAYLKSFLPEQGVLTRKKPTAREKEDMAFGIGIVHAIAGLDIGQTVVVKDKAVVAVEGLEGTDATIRRGGELAGNGIVVIKLSKPDQDMRFDVPVVGRETIDVLREAGVGLLAIEAGKTLLIDREEVLSRANQAKISIVAIGSDSSMK